MTFISSHVIIPAHVDDITTALESVQIKAEGDLDLLDFRARISLAMLLDPANDGADWRYVRPRAMHVLNQMLYCSE